MVIDSSPTFSQRYKDFEIDGYDKVRKPAAQNLIVMGDTGYEVHVDGKTDDADAIQKALNDIAAKGGGIVFLPQISENGYAIKKAITVPAGVELRSSAQGIHSFNGGRESVAAALLQIYHGKNSTEPTFTLNKGSGFKGFTIHYPEQFDNNIIPYSYTIKAIGDGVYVQNNHFINSYACVEFNGSDNHLAENNLLQHIYRQFKVINYFYDDGIFNG